MAGVVAALAVLLALVLFIAYQVISNPQTSGDPIDRRPGVRDNEVSNPTSVPPGTENVAPLGVDEMLISVSKNPPMDPCGGSGPPLRVEIMSVDDGSRRPLNDDPAVRAAVNTSDDQIWARLSPDRRRFVFYRTPVGRNGEHCRYFDQELWIANVDGSGVRKVFSNEQKAAVAAEQGWPSAGLLQGHADWSPDGRHVVMVLGHSPSFGPVPLLNQGETQLFVFDVDSGDLRQVTQRRDSQGRGVSSDPSYSPDGSTIVFVGCPDTQPSCDDTQILSVRADEERARKTSVVLDGPGSSPNDVYVSPDGRSISWMEVGLLETRLLVAPFELGDEVVEGDSVLVDAHGGYANWTADSARLVYSRLWLTDRFAVFVNSFDDQPSRRISPDSGEVFITPSP